MPMGCCPDEPMSPGALWTSGCCFVTCTRVHILPRNLSQTSTIQYHGCYYRRRNRTRRTHLLSSPLFMSSCTHDIEAPTRPWNRSVASKRWRVARLCTYVMLCHTTVGSYYATAACVLCTRDVDAPSSREITRLHARQWSAQAGGRGL